VSGGDVTHAGVVTFHRLSDNQSRVMIQIDWEPIGLLESVGAAVNADDRQIRADTKKFKEFIETVGVTEPDGAATFKHHRDHDRTNFLGRRLRRQ